MFVDNSKNKLMWYLKGIPFDQVFGTERVHVLLSNFILVVSIFIHCVYNYVIEWQHANCPFGLTFSDVVAIQYPVNSTNEEYAIIVLHVLGLLLSNS